MLYVKKKSFFGYSKKCFSVPLKTELITQKPIHFITIIHFCCHPQKYLVKLIIKSFQFYGEKNRQHERKYETWAATTKTARSNLHGEKSAKLLLPSQRSRLSLQFIAVNYNPLLLWFLRSSLSKKFTGPASSSTRFEGNSVGNSKILFATSTPIDTPEASFQ